MIGLVFPPLVESNFGAYYPSTAVLAAYLERFGFKTRQIDLNEEFAFQLVCRDTLAPLFRGFMEAARNKEGAGCAFFALEVLREHEHVLVDNEGKHRFREDRSSLGRMLSAVARMLHIDVPLEQLLILMETSSAYRALFGALFATSETLTQSLLECDLIGISVAMGPQLGPAVLLARYVKEFRPTIKVVLGGPAVSLLAAPDRGLLLQECRAIDAIVRFDGERSLAELARQVQAGVWRPNEVPACSFYLHGEVLDVPPGPGPHLDELPYALYDPALVGQLSNPELGIVLTRGCYWGRCTYCDFVELYDGSPSFRTRSSQHVIREMLHQAQTHRVSSFSIVTEALPPAAARRMAEELLKQSQRFSWNSFAMVDERFDVELLRQMVAAGCEYLVVGMETMNDRVLSLVKKAATSGGNARFVRNAHEAGLELKINIIPDLPSTTYEEAMDSLNALKEFGPMLKAIAIFPFEATRSSEIGRHPQSFGLRIQEPEHPTGQAEYAANHLSAVDPAMTKEQRAQAIAAYQYFAKNVSQSSIKPKYVKANQLQIVDRLRLPKEIVFAKTTGDTAYFCNLETGHLWSGPAGWFKIIELAQAMQHFSALEFIRRFSPSEVGEALLRHLADHDLLVTCQ